MDRFSQYREKGLHVSELAQQLWCEKRVELELLYGKEETPDMIRGSKRHRELFEEITPVLTVKTETWIDELFVKLYQMWVLTCKVLKEGRAREVPVYGKVGTMVLKGVIDELLIKDGELFVIETKTRVSGKVPDYRAYERVVHFQLSLYKLMLDHVKKGDFHYRDVLKFYKISPDVSISDTLLKSFPERPPTTNVGTMGFTAFETLKMLPEPSDTLVVRYENQKGESIGAREYTFDGKLLQETIDFVLGFWEGLREAVPPLKNPWKCDFCSEKLKNMCSSYGKMQQKSSAE